jgi:putative nucleotidyltransferase with HDIG domain
LGESVTTPTIPYHSPMDGKSGWISVTFSPRRSAAGSIVGIIAMVQDITRIKEMDNEIARQAARAEALVHTAGRLNAQLDLDTLLKTVCEETILALGVSAVVILLMDENTNVLSYASDIGIPAEIDRQRLYMPVALLKDYPFISADQTYLADFHTLVFNPPESVFSTMKVQTSACALIRRDDQLVGALTLFTFAQPRSFSHDEQELFRGLADQAAQAIVNARLFENVHRHLQQVRALHEIDVAITSNVNRALSLDVILKHVTEQLGVDTACILLLNSRTQILEFAAGHGFRTDALKYTRLELGESYAGRAAQDGRPIRVPDLRASGPFIPSPSFSAEGFISYQNTPLIAKGHVIGVLEIFNRTLLNPDATWLEFFEALSTQAAIAIDNISLFDNLQQSNVELAQAYDTTLEGWSRALELRDKETQGHTRRVAEMTGYLAEKIGLAGADLVQIRRGALLHDIGKMGIPDSILLKNGPLTAEEWLVMQKHPVYAYELLSPIAYLRSALEIPYCHHEKWDGTGYPRRLKGEEIPLGSRIFTIVDVWDALISDRPYRPAWTEEKALEYIKGQAGRHFDPQVTSLFITMIELKQFGPKPINIGANFDMIDNDYPLLGDDDRRQS